MSKQLIAETEINAIIGAFNPLFEHKVRDNYTNLDSNLRPMQEHLCQITGTWFAQPRSLVVSHLDILGKDYCVNINSFMKDSWSILQSNTLTYGGSEIVVSESRFHRMILNGRDTFVPSSMLQESFPDEGFSHIVIGENKYPITRLVKGRLILVSELESTLENYDDLTKPIDGEGFYEFNEQLRFVEDKEVYVNNIDEVYPDYIFVEDENTWYSSIDQAYNLVYVDGNGWYTHEYARYEFYLHGDGCYYDYEEEGRPYGELDDYGFRPEDEWGYETKKLGKTTSPLRGQLYYGLELEYEINRDSDIEDLVETAHNLEFGGCEDGSLSEGIEFKSKPLCIELAKSRTAQLLKDVRHDVRSERTCGLHVHVSKAGLSLMQIGLIQDFIYNKDNREFLSRLAGRPPNSYCQREFDYGVTGRLAKILETTEKVRTKDFMGGDKYEALNMCHTNTIEFRLFRSSINEVRTIGRIEFIQALIQWTSSSTRLPFNQVRNHTNFVEFVKKSGRKRFPMLLQLMYEKGILLKPTKQLNQERKEA